ncbi:MAG: hypothetical protein MJ131_09705 [Lachnospiraceae bacterium]|nr:hypothetical protein [Lachnospiraceae bacterium]
MGEVKPGEDIHLEPLTIVATRTFDSIEEMKKVEEEEGGILRLENGWVPCEENITYLVPHQGPAHPATHK